MSIFVDTSAIYPLLDRNDVQYPGTWRMWQHFMDTRARLVTTNYVLLETNTLLQRRFGMEAVNDLEDNIKPLLRIRWINERIHNQGVAAMIMANRRRLSLVDCVSFVVCFELNIQNVFCFDPHFAEQGFTIIPAGPE